MVVVPEYIQIPPTLDDLPTAKIELLDPYILSLRGVVLLSEPGVISGDCHGHFQSVKTCKL